MINEYKIEVVNVLPNQHAMSDENYEVLVNKVLSANQHLDEDSEKFNNLIKKFPEQRIIQRNPVSTINLKNDDMGMLYLDVEIRNKKMHFLIDTGANNTVLSDKALSAAGVEWNSNDKITVGSSNNLKAEMEVALLDKMLIGNIEVYNLPVIIMKVKNQSRSHIDGVLGWDVLSQLDFVIDYDKLEIRTLASNEDGYTTNFIKSSFPAILVSDKKNQTRVFGLDTGARKSWLNKSAVEAIELNIIETKEVTTFGAHGQQNEIVNIIEECNIFINNKEIIFKNISTGYTGFLNNFAFDGVLGCDILKGNIVKLVNSKGLLLLE